MKRTTYKPKKPTKKGAILIHGFTGTRYQLSKLAEELLKENYLVTTIELPEHYKNREEFKISKVSEEILKTTKELEEKHKIKKIAIIGYSLGATATVFSITGYNQKTEEKIYKKWEELQKTLKEKTQHLKQKRINHQHYKKIEKKYNEIEKIINEELKKSKKINKNVKAYVLIATPLHCNKTIPGLKILKIIAKHKKLAQKLINLIIKNPEEITIIKNGKETKIKEPKKEYFQLKGFITKKPYRFIEYIENMKDPADYIKIIENLTKLNPKKFKKYEEELRKKPKLFIYGKEDLLLRPFIKKNKKRLENFYKHCGNSKIYYGEFSHMVTDNKWEEVTDITVTNKKVIQKIKKFLKENL